MTELDPAVEEAKQQCLDLERDKSVLAAMGDEDQLRAQLADVEFKNGTLILNLQRAGLIEAELRAQLAEADKAIVEARMEYGRWRDRALEAEAALRDMHVQRSTSEATT